MTERAALTAKASEIERALRVFCVPGQVVELRALRHRPTKRVHCETFGDLGALAMRAAELDAEGWPEGIYFTPNPLRPDLVGSKASCKAADVIERHSLLIDVDPYRPSGVSSTDAEMKAAWDVCDRVRSTLDGAGLSALALGFSGNGWHPCYPILAPNDQASHELIKALLKGLHVRCGDPLTKEEADLLKAGQPLPVPKAKVETDVHDAPRIWKLYGTWARKGPNTPERPHRQSQLVGGSGYEHRPWDRPFAEANTAALRALVERWQFASDTQRGRPQTTVETYGASALRQELAAVSAATVGDRNKQLNKSAFALGQLVAGGVLLRPEVEAALHGAGIRAGLTESEVASTVRSGLEAGAKEPRGLPSANGKATAARILKTAVSIPEPLPQPPSIRVEPFPLEVLPPGLRRFVSEGAESLCCPPDYLAVPMLCAGASAIGASRALRLTGDWWVFPALYAAVVAPPSAAKSPAAARSLAALRYQQVANKARFKAERKAWDEADPKIGDRPTFCRTYTTDVTTEKLASLLADCPRGLLYHRDELVAWINSFNQYRDSGKGADQQAFMSIWDHQGISIERKGHDEGLPITVHRPCLTVFGTVQPDVLNQLTHSQDGFIERILFSYPDPTGERRWSWEGISEEARRYWREIVGRLYSLQMSGPLEEGDDPWPQFVAFAPDARPVWESWYASHQRVRADLPEALHPCHAKMESYCARLALLVELLWYAADGDNFAPHTSPDVGPAAVECAGRLVRYFLSHARRAYGCLELTPDDRRIDRVVAWIRKRGGECTPRELLVGKQAKGAAEATRLIEKLVDRCLGQTTTTKCGGNGKDVVTFHLWQSSADSAESAQST